MEGERGRDKERIERIERRDRKNARERERGGRGEGWGIKGGWMGGGKREREREHVHTSGLATSSENSESLGSGLRCTTCEDHA